MGTIEDLGCDDTQTPEEWREETLSAIRSIIGEFPNDPDLPVAVLIATGNAITGRKIADGLEVPAKDVHRVLRLADYRGNFLSVRSSRGGGRPNTYENDYRIDDQSFWVPFVGPDTLLRSEPITDTDTVAYIMHQLTPYVEFEYKKVLRSVDSGNAQAVLEEFEDRRAQLEQDAYESLARKEGIDPRWQGLPHLLTKRRRDVSDKFFLIPSARLAAEFDTVDEAVEAEFSFARGEGRALPERSDHGSFAENVTVHVDNEGEGYIVTVPNDRFEAARNVGNISPLSYQRAFAKAQGDLALVAQRALNDCMVGYQANFSVRE